MKQRERKSISLGEAMIVCVIIIALACIIILGDSESNPPSMVLDRESPTAPNGFYDVAQQKQMSSIQEVADIKENDNIIGSANPALVIIEYSDYQCPFCARSHPTLKQILNERDDVALVYRHFPLESIHPDARRAAQVAECVKEVEGVDAFWELTDIIFENVALLTQKIDAFIQSHNTQDITACISRRDIDATITAHIDQAVQLGGRGTPFFFIYNTSTKAYRSVAGALPKQEFDNILAELSQ